MRDRAACLVTPARFERATPRLGIWCSILLSYGAIAATLARRGAGATAIALFPLAQPAHAQSPHPCATGEPVAGQAQAAGTSDLFRLEGDARVFRLADIATDVPLAVPASVPITLFPVSDMPDRYGRIGVHVFRRGAWLQGEYLAAGNALADPVGRSAPCADALLAAERNTAAIPADDARAVAARTGLFTVVRGRVASVGDRERRLYLNFGQKWDEDVTASVAKTGRSRYRGDVDDLATLTGRRVEIRGTVEMNGGPLIRLKDAAQIRILSEN